MDYTIKNEKLIVTFTSKGGSITSIKNQNGLEYLWQGDEKFWSGQSPVLFPICGSLRNNEAVTLDNVMITMPRHGIVRKKEFVCEKNSSNEIIFSIRSSKEMLEQYPFEFKLYIHYLLVENQVITQYIVQNLSHKKMPYFIGAHPGFNCPLNPKLNFEDYKVSFEKDEDFELYDNEVENGLVNRTNLRKLDFSGNELPLSHDLFKKDALIFFNSNSDRVKLYSEKDPHSIEISYGDFSNLLVWSSVNNGKFIALEPMNGISTFTDESDIFEEKTQVQWLNPEELRFYHFNIIIN